MNTITTQLRETARQLLAGGEAQLVIGYAPGTEFGRVIPAFIRRPEDAGEMIFNPFCAPSLVKYLLDWRALPGKMAVVVKGCDARAVIRLLQDKQINREQVIVLGVNCPGLLNPELVAARINPQAALLEATVSDDGFHLHTDEGHYSFSLAEGLLARCRQCESARPVIADYFFGERELIPPEAGQPYVDVLSLEDLSFQEKSAYWDRYFARCLRCYACRNVCPACTCRECVFDQAEPDWVAKSVNLADNTAYHLIRAFHVAGRCVDCGECERVCPVNIPLRTLNRKLIKEIKELFAVPTPGSDPEAPPVFDFFSLNDPEKFA